MARYKEDIHQPLLKHIKVGEDERGDQPGWEDAAVQTGAPILKAQEMRKIAMCWACRVLNRLVSTILD